MLPFFAYSKSAIKISKAFKKWNCFRKIGLNTSFVVSIVRTAISVTKMISRKYKFHVLKKKMLISLSHQNFFLARSNAKSHSGFLWLVMFKFTILCVRQNSTFLSEDRNLVNFGGRVIHWVVYNQLYDWRFLFAGYCPGAVLPGHQRDRKSKKIAFLFPKICCFSLTSTIVLKKSHLTVNFSFLS